MWFSIITEMGEIKNMMTDLLQNEEQTINAKQALEEKIEELEINYKTEKTIKGKLETELEILKNKIELLSPLKVKNIELNTEINKLKQEEHAKNLERDAVISKYEQFENNAREREAKKEQENVPTDLAPIGALGADGDSKDS